MQSAANIVASAKAGMEKTKATVQEKAEKMTTRDPLQKEMATQKKEERFHEAEREKHETGGGGDYTAGGATATGERHPAVGEGGVLHPHATTTTTGGGSRVGHIDPNAGGGARTGYGSGGTH